MKNKKMEKDMEKNPDIKYEVDLLAKRVLKNLGFDAIMTEFESKKADKDYEKMMEEAEKMLKESAGEC